MAQLENSEEKGDNEEEGTGYMLQNNHWRKYIKNGGKSLLFQEDICRGRTWNGVNYPTIPDSSNRRSLTGGRKKMSKPNYDLSEGPGKGIYYVMISKIQDHTEIQVEI